MFINKALIACVVIIPLLALISNGLYLPYHVLYNLAPSIVLESGVALDATYVHYGSGAIPFWDLRGLYTKHIAPLLVYGPIFLAASLLLKGVLFLLVFKFFLKLLQPHSSALVATCLFVLAPGAENHGLAQVGIWGSPIIYYASLSAAALLIGIVLTLGKNFLLASLCFVIAIQFHPLYAASALGFFLLPYSFWFAITNLGALGGHLFKTYTPIIAALTLQISAQQGNAGGMVSATELAEWYVYASQLQPDDVTLSWSLAYGGFFILPLLVTATFLAINSKCKDILDHLTLGSVFLLFAATLLEWLHGSGLFFGKASEIVIGLQIRRGLWVPTALSFLVIFRAVSSSYRTGAISGIDAAIIAFLASAYLRPNPISLAIICALFVYRKWGIAAALATCGVISPLAVLTFDVRVGFGAMTQNVLINSILVSFTFGVVAAIFACFAARLPVLRTRTLSFVGIVAATCMFFAFSGIGYGVVTGRAIMGLSTLFASKFPHQLDWEEIENQRRSVKFDWKGRECIAQKNAGKILLPPEDAGYVDIAYYRRPIFITAYDIGGATFSPSVYKLMRDKLSAAYGPEISERFSKPPHSMTQAQRLEYFTSARASIANAHQNVSLDRLLVLRNEHAIKLIATKRPRSDLNLACKGDVYYFYEI